MRLGSALIGLVFMATPLYPLQKHPPPEKARSSEQARVRRDEIRLDNMVVRMMRRNQEMDKRMTERKKAGSQAEPLSFKNARRSLYTESYRHADPGYGDRVGHRNFRQARA